MGGLLAPFENLIGLLLSYIYEYVPSVGFSIILVTCLVMLLIFPLTHKQTKSMLAMQALQPKLKEIQAKYKGKSDSESKQKQTEETMALYKEAGVNPLGGCLPLLIQSPFFFSMYRVTRNIEQFVPEKSKLFKDLCSPVKTEKLCSANAGALRKAHFSASEAQSLADKLPIGKKFFGLNLSESLIHVSKFTPYIIVSYAILIFLIAVASYVAISRSQNLNPNAASQPAFTKYFKYFVPVLASLSPIYLPAGASLYLLTSSAWRGAQQEYLYRKIIIPHHEKKNEEDKQKERDEELKKFENYQPGLARQKRKKK
jgi:YidC/Oxa1 family membrane protein insertase